MTNVSAGVRNVAVPIVRIGAAHLTKALSGDVFAFHARRDANGGRSDVAPGGDSASLALVSGRFDVAITTLVLVVLLSISRSETRAPPAQAPSSVPHGGARSGWPTCGQNWQRWSRGGFQRPGRPREASATKTKL